MQVQYVIFLWCISLHPLFLIITISITTHSVKAILDWKYNTNGDPMVDIGYFLMMFLQPAVYGYATLARLDLLMG